jgi:hypothetical protein
MREEQAQLIVRSLYPCILRLLQGASNILRRADALQQ